jgi:hypothetical protein
MKNKRKKLSHGCRKKLAERNGSGAAETKIKSENSGKNRVETNENSNSCQ